jgi:ABC-type Zn uptake system ZnuABC Zn-binding protein ZnuA
VVATTTQIQDFVRNVGGEAVNVLAILGPGVDPHDYQPTAEDARKLAQADLVFYNGVELEPWIEDLARNARSQVPVLDLAETARLDVKAPEEEGEDEPGHAHESGDPHVWYDPTNVQKIVEVLRDTLSTQEPAAAATFAANATAYNRQLDQLDQQIQQQIGTIPAEQRKLVTSHESFRYYADRYGLDYVGSVIPSISSEAEPSAAELQRLIQEVRSQQVKAIFTERGGNQRLSERVAQQAGVKVVSDLHAETLGPPGSEADTYLKAMQHNTRLIVEGLR